MQEVPQPQQGKTASEKNTFFLDATLYDERNNRIHLTRPRNDSSLLKLKKTKRILKISKTSAEDGTSKCNGAFTV